jgi:hypothetical protein
MYNKYIKKCSGIKIILSAELTRFSGRFYTLELVNLLTIVKERPEGENKVLLSAGRRLAHLTLPILVISFKRSFFCLHISLVKGIVYY